MSPTASSADVEELADAIVAQLAPGGTVTTAELATSLLALQVLLHREIDDSGARAAASLAAYDAIRARRLGDGRRLHVSGAPVDLQGFMGRLAACGEAASTLVHTHGATAGLSAVDRCAALAGAASTLVADVPSALRAQARVALLKTVRAGLTGSDIIPGPLTGSPIDTLRGDHV